MTTEKPKTQTRKGEGMIGKYESEVVEAKLKQRLDRMEEVLRILVRIGLDCESRVSKKEFEMLKEFTKEEK